MQELGELFRTARQYGKVTLNTMDKGTYWCYIKFSCVPGVELKAEGDSQSKTPEEAVISAIKSAQKIVSDMGDLQSQVDRLKAIPHVK